MYHIKREALFGGAKLNDVNCRRLMDKNEDIIKSTRDILIEMNKCTVSENIISIYCKEHKRCMRAVTIIDDLITKTKDHICKKCYCGENLKYL